MSRWHLLLVASAVVALVLASGAMAEAGQRLGAGVHYWKTLDKIKVKDVDENGLSWIVSYQYAPSPLIKLQSDLEIFPAHFAGADHPIFAPNAFILAGGTVYAGLGIGIFYDNGNFSDNPFYALRAGIDLELLPSLYLDINANYHWESWEGLGKAVRGIDMHTITLGAAVRLAF
jgi:hypothetical protein